LEKSVLRYRIALLESIANRGSVAEPFVRETSVFMTVRVSFERTGVMPAQRKRDQEPNSILL
jgi:hypothetical protein